MLVGIVGKANVGKSTFFKALTLADALIANYPFATIKPNHGVGAVKIDCVDTFFNKQCNPREGACIEHKRFVPVDVLDVAGLVPGASEGKGMGNQFLDDLRQADVLVHVVDISGSTNEKGEPVQALSYDPANDIKFLEVELDMWYFGILKKGWDRFARQLQQEHSNAAKAIAKQLSAMKVTEEMVESEVERLGIDPLKPLDWTDDNLKDLAKFLRKRTKPMLIAANKIDIPGAYDNYLKAKKDFPDAIIIPVSAESELALREAAKHSLIHYIPGEDHFEIVGNPTEAQKKALDFIKTNILDKYKTTGAQQVMNTAVFDLLKYMAIYPGGMSKLEDQYGRVLPDCFMLPTGSTALEFAFRIHTDLGKGFIRAMDVKKRLTIGREHVLKHLDVIEIISSK